MFRTILISGAAMLLGACGHFGFSSLAPGVTTEAEVHARLGAPEASWAEPDGGKLLEYSGQPNGTFAYMILIGPDGRVKEIRSAFTEENFRRVVPGLTQDEVRRLLGHPETVVRFFLKPDENVWSWRIDDDSEKTEYFNAYFGPDDRLRRTDRTLQFKASGPGNW